MAPAAGYSLPGRPSVSPRLSLIGGFNFSHTARASRNTLNHIPTARPPQAQFTGSGPESLH
eukprot:504288-Hanusia_phi.AAC.1